ncbi:hypothetical protein HDU78_009186 [Chytriomyces hyalinus]|nr:hypothetical protein HDU78_009186 [Chytriomyces hyalinus]
MPKFVICFAQAHLNFRLAELRSLAIIENVTLDFDQKDLLEQSPFLVVGIDTVENAKKLLNRAILIKEIIQLWAADDTLEGILLKAKNLPAEYFAPYRTSSFKFDISVFGSTLAIPDQVEQINRFKFLPLEGKIDLKKPEIVFTVYQDFYANANPKDIPEKPVRLFFGPFLATSNRGLIQTYDLKKRDYLGTTSMDAELSLIMSNIALARPGSFVLDPFVGTGSFLLTSSHFGAFTLGADIDGRQIRGKGNNKNIESNAVQYDLTNRILGTVVCDIAHHPWRETEFWDAIVCDPPYGVRAGAKKIAVNPKSLPKTSVLNPDGTYKLPQTIPYELDDVLTDLLSFAAKYLTPGGRLVYWLPTVTETYDPKDVPRHKRMRMIDNCEQDFGKWARRLIVMEKLQQHEPDLDLDALLVEIEKGIQGVNALDEQDMRVSDDGLVTLIDNPAHAKFRNHYFNIGEGEAQ